MDFEFTEETCCVNCQNTLNSLQKWFYLDNYGNQQGPFDSFLILYYIHFGYFEEDSVFFMYDKFTGNPSNYNTLVNYLDTIVEDVKTHSSNLFKCTHFMENFSSVNEEYSGVSEVQMPDFPTKMRQNKEVFLTTKGMYASGSSPGSSQEFHTRNKSPSEQNEDLHKLASKTILKKRVENNLKEADAHLLRVNSRKVSHMFENSLRKEYE